jgi:outer membrane lipoprotein-sorting protein
VTSVPKSGRLLRFAAAALVGWAATSSAAAEPSPPPSLEALMAGMAKAPGVWARFVETKQIALLSEPIETHGTLQFVPPDRLLRITEAPSPSRLVIAGERFAFRDGAGADALDLSANPLAREFVDSFIVLWSGDLAKLRQRYEPTLHTSDGDWRLVLRPRQRPLSDLIERITLSGAGAELSQMEMLEQDGDRTLTRFTEVDVERHISAEEIEGWFAP